MRIAKSLLSVLLLVAIVGLLGCKPYGHPHIEIVGTVRWVELAGGFFGIMADDGTAYEPLNLPEIYQTEGTRVRVTAWIRNDYVSIFMWGTIIEILSIERLD